MVKLLICEYFDEVKCVGLDKFFFKVKIIYYKMNFNNVVYDFDLILIIICEDFSLYDVYLEVIWKWIDVVRVFYEEV